MEVIKEVKPLASSNSYFLDRCPTHVDQNC